MGMPTSTHTVAPSIERVSSDQANDTPGQSPNVRLVIEVQHDLSVRSASTSALFDGPADGLSATPGVATVTTGDLSGAKGGRKRPTIRRIVKKVASKVIPRARKCSIQVLFGRRKSKALESLLKETPEVIGTKEASSPDVPEQTADVVPTKGPKFGRPVHVESM
ncbi:MAG: hypothetical protein M1840_007808 [Geoglossum simile]|nr:MAG: hypothetical protein M1840_007808 [Geoglossum simile]